MQPQAYWYPNHLLMRIKADIDEDIIFIDGDSNIKRIGIQLVEWLNLESHQLLLPRSPKVGD